MICEVNFDTVKKGIEVKANEMLQSGMTAAEVNSQFGEEVVKSAFNYYEGNIQPEENTIFVFGSNPEGRHGKGAAKIAVDQFGAKYGQGEGLQGNAYALPTKDLRVKENNALKSISPEQITESIKKLYQVAEENSTKNFKIGYRNTNDVSLNGYTGLEMIDMFNKAGKISSNIIFSKEWVDTGKLNLSLSTGNILPSDKLVNKYLSRLNPEKKTPEQDTIFQMSSYMDKADKELDKRLIEFLKPLGVTVEMLDTLKERTGVDAVGAADIINKIILINQNKASLDTLPEEVAHFFVEFLGNQNATVKAMMSKITQWSGYQAVYDEYKDIYKGNENRIKKEAIGKLIGQYIVGNRKASLSLLQEIMEFIKQALASFDIYLINVEYLAEDIAADILSRNYSKIRQKMAPGSRVVSYAESMEKNPKVKEISDKLRNLGFYLTGSMALRKQGTVYRTAEENVHDLDFRIPNTLKDTWRQLVEKEFDTIQSERSFSRSNEDIYTMSINGVEVDFFVKKDAIPEADSENITKWQDIMGAKLGLSEGLFGTFGRTKDVVDYMTFNPTEKSAGFDNPNHVYYSLENGSADDTSESMGEEESKKED